MLWKLFDFYEDESGAVTVDWVVLTAAIVGMGVMVISIVAGGAMDHSTGTGATIGSLEPKTDW